MTIPTTCPQKSRPIGCPLNWPSPYACFELRAAGLTACILCNADDSPRDPGIGRVNVAEEAPVCLRCHVGEEIIRGGDGMRRADAARSSR